MKRILICLCVCTLGFNSQAQVTQLPDNFTSGKAMWIIKVGASYNKVTGSDVDDQKEAWQKNNNNYDFGVVAGAGIWFGHFNLDLIWQRGFISIYDTDSDMFSNNMQVRLGYAF